MKLRIRESLSGVLAAAGGLAAAELAAAIIRPESSPLIAVGSFVIDATPTPVKEFAVKTVGTYDKPLLLAGILLFVLAACAVLGIVASVHRRLAIVLISALGLVPLAAVLTRPASRPFDAVPTVIAALVAPALLAHLTRRPSISDDAQPAGPAAAGSDSRTVVSRRKLLEVAGSAIAAASAAKVVTVVKGRSAPPAMAIPAAVDPAPEKVASAGFYTPNPDFYRVDTSLTVPRIDVESWQLKISGLVERPYTITFADLLREPLIERDITLNCVSNEVGGPYIGTARWIGAPLARLLKRAGIKAGADQIVARSVEGMTIGTPVETVLDGRDAMIAVGMNGVALPPAHGYPARMLTPGLYGYAGACKWVTELELSTFDSYDAYWVKRGWARYGPVKTASRIDRPAPFEKVKPGRAIAAGVAWAQHRGISRVEVQIDDGPWAQASLIRGSSTDTWVQWRFEWQAETGPHALRVRATDGQGDVQTADRATPFPDGATGWHTIAVTVL